MTALEPELRSHLEPYDGKPMACACGELVTHYMVVGGTRQTYCCEPCGSAVIGKTRAAGHSWKALGRMVVRESCSVCDAARRKANSSE